MKSAAEIIEGLRAKLKLSLPGEAAQYRMAPSYRARLTKQEIATKSPRVSGVMVLLYEKENELHLVFTQRHTYEGVHSGQMSFPGGKKDESDIDLTETALRETWEEVGIERDDIELLGQLSELYIPPSNFLVQPTVGFAKQVVRFMPQEKEVEKVVEIPLNFLLDYRNINLQTEIKIFGGSSVQVPAYIYNGHVIWGATAIILSEFTFIVEEILKEN